MKTLDEKETWQAALGELEVVFSKANYSTWFKDTFVLEIAEDEITVGVPNAFTKEWLENKYHPQIFEVLKKIHPNLKNATYAVATNSARQAPKIDSADNSDINLKPTQSYTPTQIPVADKPQPAFNLNAHYSFDNYVVGNSNRLAMATAQAVAANPGTAYNPLFIYGGVGLGKTHLVQAIGNEIIAKSPKKKIVYVSCEKFTNDFIASISDKKTNEFKKMYRDADVLMVDDIQFMAGKEGTQEEFFHTFNALHQANRQIVITSDRVPKAIPQLTDRLSSRFGMGMVADIQPPNLEMRQAILRNKCAEKQCSLTDDVIDYIAQNIESNIRELEGAITRILTYSQMNDVLPSLAITTKALEDIISNKNKIISVEKMLQMTADFFNITTVDLISAKRNKELVRPRQIVMYLMRHEMSLSYPKIGQHLNKKDHTTVIHGVEKIEKEIARDVELHKELTALKEKMHAFN
ncbi:TPA: chromosomal replication initiator protein DnaA [Candidatus Berkelbacteria bacterium]|uniref:Chromosomal replication initiator protein DnaA n=1 Tax=Berkelbacteria bacterium GW2011_GWE1_39_12 TaxID=1618337 RepID=A0A0G4B5K0_9BACT|nr:MAG: chromosomal replication initiator protein DnaA [Berkelbacteria bacterium GW2011_GWE1_39_12]HBO60848.1 chromosomal replication initiator protein DnaA [Candidatus Berkelbacteria bacterium]